MGMGSHWVRSVGYAGEPIAARLRRAPLPGQRIGDQLDLTGVEHVWVVVRALPDRQLLQAGQVDVIGQPTDGRVQAALTPAVVAYPGFKSVQFVATWPNGDQFAYPSNSGADELHLRVRGDYMTSASPVPPAGEPGGPWAEANDEVGHGQTLPLNGDLWQLFEIENSLDPNVADGLYRWDDNSLTWVPVG